MSDVIRAIEQAYAFSLPTLYQQLYHDGMLDWFLDSGFPNPNWYADVFPRLRARPPVLLFAQDFELYAPETVPGLLPGEDWGPTYRFVPLGQTAGGDLYAFCPTLASAAGDAPITLSRHDENTTTVLAPSLEAFILRGMLDRATSFDEYALEGYADFEDLRVGLQRAAQSISPYLKPAWGALLADVYARPLRQETVVLPRRQYTIDALLSEAEFEEILQREMGFDLLNHTFEHFPQ